LHLFQQDITRHRSKQQTGTAFPKSEGEPELLFQFFSDRYERASVALTSNLAFAQWTQVFGNEQMTAALLDRLVHRSHILMMEGESFRFRQSLQKQDLTS
jgi:DNA replication protein DnaC